MCITILSRDRARGERGRARARRPSSLARLRSYISSFGGNETGPLSSRAKSALRTATRARGQSRARSTRRPTSCSGTPPSRVSRGSRDRARARPHRRASRPRRPPPISPICAMMARSGGAKSRRRARDAGGEAARGRRGHHGPPAHPANTRAAFANTVYVDPVIKVRRRARVPFSKPARDRKRASRAPYTDVRPARASCAPSPRRPRNTAKHRT